MSSDQRKALARISDFGQLVNYLREQLGWPIEGDDFDDLVFDYTPEELGIDAENAAKIRVIKRLRPLTASQPWGILFVEFEPKQLPLVALRRILSRVALKKRASANNADTKAWAMDDLLFISTYGVGDKRKINFAHFSRPEANDKLPTLKVLYWDNLDTAHHLDDVVARLSSHLAWPTDEDDTDAWRANWRAAFTVRHGEVISTSKELSVQLALLARSIRDQITTTLEIETDTGPITALMKAFKEGLVQDLDSVEFADMYAQTIAYGLLSARIVNPHNKTADDLANHMRTSPFLGELMETFLKVGGQHGTTGAPGIDFDELGVGQVVELLDNANMEAILRDFGDRNPQEDPVIHFYEHFLAAYDKEQKVRRGVFYTPRSVVTYIVDSLDELLRKELGLADGLADISTWGEVAARVEGLEVPEDVDSEQAFVQILDPATGTGTFLVEVIDRIHTTLVAKWRDHGYTRARINELWNKYVRQHLLTRLHGYELLMAPYAIAHLKVGLKLLETGYQFESEERARIFLTNALEPPQDFSDQLDFAIEALAHEAQAVNEIKRHTCFTVVLGNPPYAGISSNNSEHAVHLVDAYKKVDGEDLGERKLWLQDDYVKFLRFAEMRLMSSRIGALGYITNHGFLDNPTFRGMRQHLMTSFSPLWILDLHGNTNKGESGPGEGNDENVFDIKQGVAITLGVVRQGQSQGRVERHDLWGERALKYEWLDQHTASTTEWVSLLPRPPYRFFAPWDVTIAREYDRYFPLEEVVRDRSVGMITARDSLTIQFSQEEIQETVELFASLTADEARREFSLGKDARDWSVERAQSDLRLHQPSEDYIRRVLYRPFDHRYTVYTGTSRGFIGQPQKRIMGHLDGKNNFALCVSRFNRQKSLGYFFVTRELTDFHLLDTVADSMTVFPLFLTAGPPGREASTLFDEGVPNLSIAFQRRLVDALGEKSSKPNYGVQGIDPEDVFRYIYAIFHSPEYRGRYADFLKIEFPRIPLPQSLPLFRRLVEIGERLIALHLLESPSLDDARTTYTGPEDPTVGRVGWSDDIVWLDAAKTRARDGHRATEPGLIGFHGVESSVWDFHVGGYQVCHKWLKDRKGRRLSNRDIKHYHKLVEAVRQTIALMNEIDAAIANFGGWPGAFEAE